MLPLAASGEAVPDRRQLRHRLHMTVALQYRVRFTVHLHHPFGFATSSPRRTAHVFGQLLNCHKHRKWAAVAKRGPRRPGRAFKTLPTTYSQKAVGKSNKVKGCAAAGVPARSPAPLHTVQVTRNQASTSVHASETPSASNMPEALAGDTPSRCSKVDAYFVGMTCDIRGRINSVFGASDAYKPRKSL